MHASSLLEVTDMGTKATLVASIKIYTYIYTITIIKKKLFKHPTQSTDLFQEDRVVLSCKVQERSSKILIKFHQRKCSHGSMSLPYRFSC